MKADFMFKKQIQNAIILLLLALLFSCTSSEKVTVLKLAHILDPLHPVHQGMEYLAQRLQEKSNGKMRIDIYPSGQLGSEREYVESLQIGSLDMTKVSSSVVENFVPEMAVFSLPYLFRDDAHRWQVLKGEVGKDLLFKGEKFWLRGLCYYETGNRNFYLRDRAVHTPDDLKGLKIRVMRSYWSIRTINALGGSATPISFGELYTALQQGVVDAAENNIPTFFQSKHYEACKYLVLDGHSAPSDVLLISTHRWKKLSLQQQQWLEQAVEESVEYQRKLWGEVIEQNLNTLRAAGVTIIYPDKSPFREKVKPLYAELKHSDIALYNLVEKIRAVGN